MKSLFPLRSPKSHEFAYIYDKNKGVNYDVNQIVSS